MKFKQLVLILALYVSILPVMAYTSTDELTSPEQLINYNYSRTSAEHVQLNKHQNRNLEYKTERILNLPWYKKFWNYIDPANDDGTLLQHSIQPGSSWKDY